MKDRIEDTDGYAGLYGEVVTEDVYQLRTLQYVPDVIIDLGANVGVFSRYAHELFPNAAIFGVEPHEENIDHYKRFCPNHALYRYAIGEGKLVKRFNPENGAHASYLTGTKPDGFVEIQRVGMPLREFLELHAGIGKVFVKMDIEGNEVNVLSDDRELDSIFFHATSFVAEIHFHVFNDKGKLWEFCRELGVKFASAGFTVHSRDEHNIMFYAHKADRV